ncbi:MAG: GntR family transcriptional regulator [Acidobacteriaceae bacterium]|nr:GntR family transcriptional regulator [Acidobacteriaceae bacterium]
MAAKRTTVNAPKYQKLFESLKADIISGRYKPGQKMPSEAALVYKSGASRITVGRAIRELQNLGLVERMAGSGTYVRDVSREQRPHLFGLLIPDLGETEIFEPICQGIANAPEATEHALLWGHTDTHLSKTEQAWRLCQQYIGKNVSGVFFAALEFEAEAEKVNRRILKVLSQAGIAVVLLDRRSSKAPERHRPDLVGINNHQAGYIATEHLIQLGCRRIGFLGYHGALSTIAERMAGYQDALAAHGLRPAIDPTTVQVHPHKEQSVSWSSKSQIDSVEAFVCVNDRVAGQLMHLFLPRGIRIPEDVRLVGIDDVSYASLLPVPLTTVRQPVREIGEAALRTMLDRLRTPRLPPREVLLDGDLVIRKSCGAHP